MARRTSRCDVPPTALSARDHMGSCGSSPYIHIYIENGVESGARERASQSALFTVDCTCSTNQYTRGLFCFLKGRIFENFLLQRSQALKVKGRVPPRTVPFAPSCMEYGNLPARPRPRASARIHTVRLYSRGLPLLVTTQHSVRAEYLVIVDGLQLVTAVQGCGQRQTFSAAISLLRTTRTKSPR